MPDTFVKIASVTVGSGGASSIDFTSIPSTYTDLCLLVSGRSTGNNGVCYLYFNSDFTGSNYATRRLLGTGTTVSSGAFGTTYAPYTVLTGSTANTFSNSTVYIPNYRGSTNKSFSSDDALENNAAASDLVMTAGIWNNTAAITSIKMTQVVDSGFVQYTTATLYGIKNS